MATKLKLFVWSRFSPDYTGGLAFAIAKDETEAKKLVEKQRGYEVLDWGNLTIYRIDRRIAHSVCGGG